MEVITRRESSVAIARASGRPGPCSALGFGYSPGSPGLLILLVLSFLPWSCAPRPPAPPRAGSGYHDDSDTSDIDGYIRRLEDAGRAEYQKPAEVVASLEIKPGATVADIGAGSGYFTVRFARAVGSEGVVYAVDTEPRLLDYLRDRVVRMKAWNVRPIHGRAGDPILPWGSVDLVFVCNTWHLIEDRHAYLDRLREALKVDGRLAIVDYHKRRTPIGPPVAHRLSREDVISEMREAHFALEAEHKFLPYQYFLVFRPSWL